MRKTTLALFLAVLALLVGGVAAHTTDRQPVRRPDLPPPPPGWHEMFAAHPAFRDPASIWWTQATDRVPVITAAPVCPGRGPNSSAAAACATANVWRNPVRETVERIRQAWHTGSLVPQRRGRSKQRLSMATAAG